MRQRVGVRRAPTAASFGLWAALGVGCGDAVEAPADAACPPAKTADGAALGMTSAPVGVQGDGYFVLWEPLAGGAVFTRDPRFHVAADGRIEHISGAQLAGWPQRPGAPTALAPVEFEPIQVAQPTTAVEVGLDLSTSDDVPIVRFDLDDLDWSSSWSLALGPIYDADGAPHAWTLYLSRSDARAYDWHAVARTYYGDLTVAARGRIEAQADGAVTETAEAYDWWPAADRPGQPVSVRFSGFDGAEGTRLHEGAFALEHLDLDGRSRGTVTGVEVDPHGEARIQYSNGRWVRWGRIPLASFDAPCWLQVDERGLSHETGASGPHRLSYPGYGADVGEIVPGRIGVGPP